MLPHDDTRLDAILLVRDDLATAERTIGALAAASIDTPLRIWAFAADGAEHVLFALRRRCPWVRFTGDEGDEASRVALATSAGRAEFVLFIDAGTKPSAEAIRALVQQLDSRKDLSAVSLLDLPAFAAHAGQDAPILVRREALAPDAPIRHQTGRSVAADADAWRRAQIFRPVASRTASPLKLAVQRDAPALDVNRRRYRERHRPSPQLLDRSPEALRGELFRRVREAFASQP